MEDIDNEVGYKKPPKSGQFKPGQSGNPRGRPKGSASIESLIEKELRKKVAVQINGEARKMTVKRAIALGIVKIGLSGSASDRLKALQVLRTIEANASIGAESENGNFDFSALNSEELDTLEALLSKMAGEEPQAPIIRGKRREETTGTQQTLNSPSTDDGTDKISSSNGEMLHHTSSNDQ